MSCARLYLYDKHVAQHLAREHMVDERLSRHLSTFTCAELFPLHPRPGSALSTLTCMMPTACSVMELTRALPSDAVVGRDDRILDLLASSGAAYRGDPPASATPAGELLGLPWQRREDHAIAPVKCMTRIQTSSQ